MAAKNGSASPGPSKVYVRLLEGKIDSSRYTNAVKRSVGLKPAPKPKDAKA